MPRWKSKILAPPLAQSLHWIDDYSQAELTGKDPKTVDAYARILRQVALWLAEMPGGEGRFHPANLTADAVADYIEELRALGSSPSHLSRIVTVLKRFSNWLIARGLLDADPTRGIAIPAQPEPAARELTREQRAGLCRLVKRAEASPRERGRSGTSDLRGTAIFTLGYWAGCRASDVSRLLVAHAHLDGVPGWLRVGFEQGNYRDIPVRDEVREALVRYVGSGSRQQTSTYLITSQRQALPAPNGDLDGWRLGEAAIHAWWKGFKMQATEEDWRLLSDITFRDLRHDFERRAQDAGFERDELAWYLGLATRRAHPALARSLSEERVRELLREKLETLKG